MSTNSEVKIGLRSVATGLIGKSIQALGLLARFSHSAWRFSHSPPAKSYAQVSTETFLAMSTTSAGVRYRTPRFWELQSTESHSVDSDRAGEYIFTLLQPGHYSLEVSATGFQPYHIDDLSLSAGDRRRVVITMLPR